MPICFKSILACLAMAALLAAAGCGDESEATQSTTAAIQGPDDGKAATDAKSDGSAAGGLKTDRMHPCVVLDTSLGRITLRLDAEKAPLTVDNFLSYVDNGHYDQTIFHQVFADFPKLILGGAYTADGTEKRTFIPVRNEADNGLKNTRGSVAMARQADAIDSATCHFFLNLTDNEVLDHKDRTLAGYGYCVFGKVIEGMDVVDKIGAVAVHDTEKLERTPVEVVAIRSMRQVQ